MRAEYYVPGNTLMKGRNDMLITEAVTERLLCNGEVMEVIAERAVTKIEQSATIVMEKDIIEMQIGMDDAEMFRHLTKPRHNLY